MSSKHQKALPEKNPGRVRFYRAVSAGFFIIPGYDCCSKLFGIGIRQRSFLCSY
jgi:hypothetical protein